MENRIKEWRDRRKLTQEQLGQMVGSSGQQIYKLEKSQRSLRQYWLEKLALALQVEPHELLPQVKQAPGLSESQAFNLPYTNIDKTRIITDELVGERDLPVYGSASGGPGQMVISYDPIEYVRRPSILLHVRGGFAMYVIGDSMNPRYYTGDMILIHPTRPPRPQDFVLVVLQNGNHDSGEFEVMVKRLIKMDESKVSLEQFNPSDSFEIPRAHVQKVMKIVGSYDAL